MIMDKLIEELMDRFKGLVTDKEHALLTAAIDNKG